MKDDGGVRGAHPSSAGFVEARMNLAGPSAKPKEVR